MGGDERAVKMCDAHGSAHRVDKGIITLPRSRGLALIDSEWFRSARAYPDMPVRSCPCAGWP